METKTTAMDFIHASQMPAITWHYLDMNETSLEIPAGLAIAPLVEVDEPWLSRGAADEFENAMDEAQNAWAQDHPEPSAADVAAWKEAMEAEAGATYGGTARSTYQYTADAKAEARSVITTFEHGTGNEVAAYLRSVAGDRIVVSAAAGKTVDAEVRVGALPNAISVAAIDVVADANSTVNLSVVLDGEGDCDGALASNADYSENSFAGTTIRVFADSGATVVVERLQALCEDVKDIDAMALFAAEGASIKVRQTVLGASHAYTGLACDLRGDTSTVAIDTRYLGRGVQERDFNYVVNHHGKKTESDLVANGVLSGTSRKCLRGTIDFVRGCAGSEGSENETVLLVDEGVRNKTVPTLLCNEDDVAGNHGATIGHIREGQLFYLTSRGLTPEAAEAMFVSALVEQAVLDASTDRARQAAMAFGERIAPGFAERFSEEV